VLLRCGRFPAELTAVTPRPSASDQIGDQLAAQDGLWELSADLLATANTGGYLTCVSPSWEKTLGWSPEDLTGRPYLDFVHLSIRRTRSVVSRDTPQVA